MAASGTIVDLLGGRAALGSVNRPPALRDLVRRGLPYASLERLTKALQISTARLDATLRLPARTLARRKKERRLSPDESDRIYRLAHVAALAVETLGERERAIRWLQRPNRALGGEAPIALLDTEIGTRQVEAVLGRIAHGVIS